MLTFENVFEIFKDYLEADTDLEIVSTKRGYLRVLWDGTEYSSVDDALSRTPEELFNHLLSDCEDYHLYLLTKGKGEQTDADRALAKAQCAVYLDRRQAIVGRA